MSIEKPGNNQKDSRLEAFHKKIKRLVDLEIKNGTGHFDFLPEYKTAEGKSHQPDQALFDPEKLTLDDFDYYEKYEKGDLTIVEVRAKRDEVEKTGNESQKFFYGYLVNKLQERFF